MVSDIQQKLLATLPLPIGSAKPDGKFSRAFFTDESLLSALNVDSRLELKVIVNKIGSELKSASCLAISSAPATADDGQHNLSWCLDL